MKKFKIIIVICLLIIGMVGCENNMTEKAIEQGKLAMANKEYDKAMTSFQLAIDEGSKDEDIIKMCEILECYNKANNEYNSGNIEKAKVLIDKLDEDYTKYSIKDDVINLNNKINEINNSIDQIKELIAQKEYSQAKELIEKLNEKDLNEGIKKEIAELNDVVDSKLEQIEADKKEEEQQQQIISEDEALDKTINYVKSSHNSIPEDIIKVLEVQYQTIEGKTGYLIHVVEDHPDHVSTIGYYLVDKNTGHIYENLAGSLTFVSK